MFIAFTVFHVLLNELMIRPTCIQYVSCTMLSATVQNCLGSWEKSIKSNRMPPVTGDRRGNSKSSQIQVTSCCKEINEKNISIRKKNPDPKRNVHYSKGEKKNRGTFLYSMINRFSNKKSVVILDLHCWLAVAYVSWLVFKFRPLTLAPLRQNLQPI